MDGRGNKRFIQGVVVSDDMDKTIVVRSERLVKHPVFHKYVRKWKKYKAHDEGNQCKVGDKVIIVESRPLSREKRWRVREVLERAK
jgi:small subunit ribosomal protein S17